LKKLISTPIILLLTFAPSFLANSSDSNVVMIPSMKDSVEVKIDGKKEGGEWLEARKVSLDYVRYPNHENLLPAETDVWMMSDRNAIYFFIKASLNPKDGGIQGVYSKHDNINRDEDYIQLNLATTSSHNVAQFFTINAFNTRADGVWSSVDKTKSFAWDGIWDSASTFNEHAYFIEVRIPFENLTFSDSAGLKDWKIGLIRNYPHDNKQFLLNYELEQIKQCESCHFPSYLGFKGIEQGESLAVEAGAVYRRTESKSGDDQENVSDVAGVSLDIEYKPTSQSNVNLTINPDFSTTAMDSLTVDVNSPYVQYLNEKRRFFSRDMNVFDGQQELIYTRNMISPEYGVKYTSQSDIGDVGLFYVKDERTSYMVSGQYGSYMDYIESSSDNVAFRYRKHNQGVSYGAYATYKGSQGYRNNVYSGDVLYNIDDNTAIDVQLTFSDTHNVDGVDGSGRALSLGYEKTGADWLFSVDYFDTESLRADLGYMPKTDQRTLSLYAEKNHDLNYDILKSLTVDFYYDHEEGLDGRHMLDEVGVSFYNEMAYETTLIYGYNFSSTTPFKDSDERFKLHNNYASVFFDYIKDVSLSVSITYGDQVDYINSSTGKSIYIFGNVSYALNGQSSLYYGITQEELKNSLGESVFDYVQHDFGLTQYFTARSSLRIGLSVLDLEMAEGSSSDVSGEVVYSYLANDKIRLFLGAKKEKNTFEFAQDEDVFLEKRYFVKASYLF